MSLLKLSAVSKFKDGRAVLENISFGVQTYQKTAIAGATGSGKTTLLKIIAGLVQPDAGEVLLRDVRIEGPDEKLIPGHASIAYLSQHFELRNNYRVEEIFEYANVLSVKAAAHLFEVCRVNHLLKRRTDQLSGGEKQRIAIARLLIGRPSLLLLDEPFSNLDLFHKQVMKSVIHDIAEQLKITCMMVSHDPLDTLSWADQIIILKEGRLLQQGTATEVYRYPVDEYAAALFGAYNLIPSGIAARNGAAAISRTNGKHRIFRPESISISTTEKTKLKGKVKQELFFGSYYEVNVQVKDMELKVRNANGGFQTGDEVYLSFDAG
jgi:ABC-type Fe3+/spermidine/putrescine transport system ATPase subunit